MLTDFVNWKESPKSSPDESIGAKTTRNCFSKKICNYIANCI